ncbi:Disease resistance protein (NBS-LRR class) family [Raphanus sativus]|uniref:Probable disease resistance protein At5g04720 n=1 Tax=Raphanus sativus TaxID=3726 RepID=A0A6J0KDH4_RAPSA|nr:probable disease resistance protein At5g04720 [Raphanus sativus]KAJ4883500.1 Disease resistance protein (NBS-LRR class) family [Raphanus sativus]
MAELIGGEVVTELVKQLFAVSRKAVRCRGVAKNLGTMIEGVQPTIKEILYSGVEVSPHRQVQLRMFSETLDKCKKLTDKVLQCHRWNMVRQLYHAKKMEDLEKKIAGFIGRLPLHVLCDVHHLRADSEVRFDRIDRGFDSLTEKLGSMKIRGGGLVQEEMKPGEATMEMLTDGGLGNLGVGLDLGKRKVKEMMFGLRDEGGLVGISGMSGSGKTTLAKELARDEEVLGHFGRRVLFLTASQSPNIEELKAFVWGFLTGNDDSFGAAVPESVGQTRRLVILDDVWTRESLDKLMFNIPGTTTLVVSRSKLADPRTTYDVELLNEAEATSLFCLSAFNEKSIPSGFSKWLVKQVVAECKGLPLSLKVVGASLKGRPEKYWEGVVNRLSRGEPADETHDSRVFAQIEATLETLDPKTRECFIDMGAFPEDKKIPLDVIINMWVEMYDLEDATAFAVLVDLSNRNLLTIVKDPRFGAMYTSYYDIFVTQHDVLRDLALHLSNRGRVNKRERLLMPRRESVVPREWERSNDEPYNARIVSIHTEEMTEMEWFDMELPKAEVLILNFSAENYVLPPFIAKMGRLRALVIINNGMSPARLHDFSNFTNLAKLKSLWLERVHVPELSTSTVPLKSLRKMSLILCKINNSFDQTAVDMSQIFPNLSDLTIDHCDDLVELPATVCGITSLNSISVTNCPRINELPKNLSKLKALQLLRLYACLELKTLPVEVCELPRLKYLDISQCVNLSFLPEEIGKVRTLEKIDMRECSLRSIPSSAVSLTSLRHVICDKETLGIWEHVEKVVPGIRVEGAEKCFSLDWLKE